MKEMFGQLRNVIRENPGRWPVALMHSAAVLAFAFFCAVGLYGLVWSSDQPVLASLQQQETALLAELKSRYAKANGLALFRRQQPEIQRRFGTMQAQLPGATELPSLLVDISQAASDAALENRLFTPGNELRHELYAETPIRMRLTGTFHQLGRFLSGIAGLTRLVTVHDLQIIPVPNAARSDALQLDVTARTYRYLSDDEIKVGAVPGAKPALIEAIRTEPAVRIEPLPDWQPPDRYTYAAADRRSPFAPEDAGTSLATPVKSDLPEQRATLRQSPIETMQMVGTLHISGHDYGLIRVPNGLIHRVEVGHIVGLAGGRITAIHDHEIRVTELRPDASGRHLTQVVSIGLHQ